MAQGKTKAEKEAEARQKKVDEAILDLIDKGVEFQDSNDFVNQLLDQAEDLAKEKEEVYGRIGANRETLRNVLGTGLLSEEQARSILGVYPPVARSENGQE